MGNAIGWIIFGDEDEEISTSDSKIEENNNQENKSPEETVKIEPRPAPFTDPFSVLADVTSGRLKLDKNDLYGLPVNVIVVEILEAAKQSAKSGKTVMLK